MKEHPFDTTSDMPEQLRGQSGDPHGIVYGPNSWPPGWTEPTLPPLTVEQFRELLRKKAEELGSQEKLALSLCVSAQFVCDVIKGRRGPSETLAEAMGYRRVVVFVPFNKDKEAA